MKPVTCTANLENTYACVLSIRWCGFQAAVSGWNGQDGRLWSEYPVLGLPAVPLGAVVKLV